MLSHDLRGFARFVVFNVEEEGVLVRRPPSVFEVALEDMAARLNPEAISKRRGEFPVFQQVAVKLGKSVAFLVADAQDYAGDPSNFLSRYPVTDPSYKDPDLAISTTIQAASPGLRQSLRPARQADLRASRPVQESIGPGGRRPPVRGLVVVRLARSDIRLPAWRPFAVTRTGRPRPEDGQQPPDSAR
jgi:hypothetical protein